VGWTVTAFVALYFVLFAGTTLAPVFSPHCPYKTPFLNTVLQFPRYLLTKIRLFLRFIAWEVFDYKRAWLTPMYEKEFEDFLKGGFLAFQRVTGANRSRDVSLLCAADEVLLDPELQSTYQRCLEGIDWWDFYESGPCSYPFLESYTAEYISVGPFQYLREEPGPGRRVAHGSNLELAIQNCLQRFTQDLPFLSSSSHTPFRDLHRSAAILSGKLSVKPGTSEPNIPDLIAKRGIPFAVRALQYLSFLERTGHYDTRSIAANWCNTDTFVTFILAFTKAEKDFNATLSNPAHYVISDAFDAFTSEDRTVCMRHVADSDWFQSVEAKFVKRTDDDEDRVSRVVFADLLDIAFVASGSPPFISDRNLASCLQYIRSQAAKQEE